MYKKLKITVCALANLDNNPRPNRMVSFLKKNSDVTYVGFASTQKSISFYKIKKNNSFYVKGVRSFFKIFRMHSNLEKLNYRIEFDFNSQDIVICHDLELLPYILKSKKKFKLIFDAREYYPKHFENNFSWRILQSPYQIYLCSLYLKYIDYGMTVSNGLKKAYKDNFFIEMDVFYSLPDYVKLPVNQVKEKVRVVHHGSAVKVREIERMIYAMDAVNENVTLDLMLVGNQKYIKKLLSLTESRANVKIIKPVPFSQIIPTLSTYDIGLIFFPPATFNLEHCMPNKLFEYIQARLAIISAPLADLKSFVEEHNIGIVSQSFEHDSLAQSVNSLSELDIIKYKSNCESLSRTFSQETNNNKIKKVISKLTSTELGL